MWTVLKRAKATTKTAEYKWQIKVNPTVGQFLMKLYAVAQPTNISTNTHY